MTPAKSRPVRESAIEEMLDILKNLNERTENIDENAKTIRETVEEMHDRLNDYLDLARHGDYESLGFDPDYLDRKGYEID